MENFNWILVNELTDADIWSPSLGSTTESSKPLEIRFNEPAKHWTDALPIGNGRLGAMVWGGVVSETLNLNGNRILLKVYLRFVCRLFLSRRKL